MHLPKLANESSAEYRARFAKKWNRRAKEAAKFGPQVKVRNLSPEAKAKLRAEIAQLQKLLIERELKRQNK